VEIAADRVSVTPSGRLFLRNIGMCFDRYLRDAASEQPRYSRTA
jgi:oxygen-independent coproporphyrinogen-3 oxidase